VTAPRLLARSSRRRHLRGLFTPPRRDIRARSDAAHTVHPLAGQGLNLGIGDAEELVSVLAQGVAVGTDVGALGLLRQYERRRAAHNAAAMGAMDTIKRAFTSTVAGHVLEPWVAARNLGMGLLNAAGPVKAQLARLAMGSIS
jgi:2-polyprenyl-6-methoxyphenol hydroxylase-like FAD-dependent oxidoreductase